MLSYKDLENKVYMITATMTPSKDGLVPCVTCTGTWQGTPETSYLYQTNLELVKDHAFKQGEEAVLLCYGYHAILVFNDNRMFPSGMLSKVDNSTLDGRDYTKLPSGEMFTINFGAEA